MDPATEDCGELDDTGAAVELVAAGGVDIGVVSTTVEMGVVDVAGGGVVEVAAAAVELVTTTAEEVSTAALLDAPSETARCKLAAAGNASGLRCTSILRAAGSLARANPFAIGVTAMHSSRLGILMVEEPRRIFMGQLEPAS